MSETLQITAPSLSLLRYDKISSFLFIDFETYNLNLHPEFNAPWQVGMLKVRGGKVVDSFEYLFNWKGKFVMKPGNPSFNHYSERTIQEKGLEPKDITEKILYQFQNTDYIVGHNLMKFDVFLMKNLFEMFTKANYLDFVSKIIDTKSLATAIKLNVNKDGGESLQEFQFRFLDFFKKGLKTNQITLAKEMNIPIDETRSHDAIYDLTVNYELFKKQVYQLDI